MECLEAFSYKGSFQVSVMSAKKIDIFSDLRYTYKHIRDRWITGEHLINCPRTQAVPCFRVHF